MNFVKTALAAGVMTSLPALVAAGTITIDPTEYVENATAVATQTITADMFGSGAFNDTNFNFGFSVLDLFTTSSLDSFDVTSASEFGLAFDTTGFDTDTVSSIGGASEVSLMDGELQVLFENVLGKGIFAGIDAALVTFTSVNLELDGTGGFLDFIDENGDTSTLRVQGLTAVAPIPLPAGMPLILAGLGAVYVVGRRRKAST